MYIKERSYLDKQMREGVFDESYCEVRKKMLMKDIIVKQNDYIEILYEIGEACRDKMLSLTLQEWIIVFRPKTDTITFVEFYAHMKKLSESDMYLNTTISFEQTGVTVETLGTGFHCNFVFTPNPKSLQGYKAIERDLNKRFKKLIDEGIMIFGPGIHIQKCRDDNYVQKYMIEYESVDGHKAPTMESDKMWRKSVNIENIYYDSLPLLVSLPSYRANIEVNMVVDLN